MSRKVIRFIMLPSVGLASLAACSPPNAERKQIVRESAERDATIKAAKNHPANEGNAEATGKPLPPLPGVDTPAPRTEGNQAEHEDHDEHRVQHNHP